MKRIIVFPFMLAVFSGYAQQSVTATMVSSSTKLLGSNSGKSIIGTVGEIAVLAKAGNEYLGSGIYRSNGFVLTPSGVETITNENAINVYPNPATSHIQFSEFANAKLYNIAGQLVAEKQNANVLDISGLSSGVYILTLTTKQGAVQRTKVVKE